MSGLKSCGKLAFGPQPLNVTGDLMRGSYNGEALLTCRKEALRGAGGGLGRTVGFSFSVRMEFLTGVGSIGGGEGSEGSRLKGYL